jgi:hypothetical protein
VRRVAASKPSIANENLFGLHSFCLLPTWRGSSTALPGEKSIRSGARVTPR